MSHAFLLPLDNRPCTSRFPIEIASVAGFDVSIPPLALLGDVRKPASFQGLLSWLEAVAAQASLVVISLDTWLYGGLVFSRKVSDTLADLSLRLQLLADFKKRFPQLRIAVFGTLLRLSNHNDATEERTYWAQYGEQIFRYAWLEDILQLGPNLAYQSEYELLAQKIPVEILADYKSLRQRNLNLLMQAIELVQRDVFDYLYIGCDDSGQYGWNVQEKKQILKIIQAQELADRVLLYPGADELASVLLMRMLIPESFKIAIAYTSPQTALESTLYEGIPLAETLAAQAQAAGFCFTSEAEAQALLWIHNPPQAQVDQYLDRISRQSLTADDYLHLGQKFKALTQPFAIADICYANGGDHALLEILEDQNILPLLKGYTAWNTTGNTLGFALAWLKAWIFSSQVENQDFTDQTRLLLARLLDDGWYQGFMRQRLCQHYSEPVTLDSCLRLLAFSNERLKLWQNWLQPLGWSSAEIRQIHFPWRRFFEIDLSVCLKKTDDRPLSDPNQLVAG
jgi:hypothetical protein